MPITKAAIAKIHIAKKQLALSDDDYRAALRGVAGVASSKDLTPEGAHKLLKHFERCGFTPSRNHGRRPHVAPTRAAQVRKIEMLLAEQRRPWRYIDGMVKRICKVRGGCANSGSRISGTSGA